MQAAGCACRSATSQAITCPSADDVTTDVIDQLGLDPAISAVLGATEKDLAFMTIGGKDLEAFFGINGPYWIDANANGLIDRDPVTHQIIAAETNPDAIGLVIDNLTFGIAIMTPVNPIDPSRYLALSGHADFVGIVGLEEYLVVRAEQLTVELNISTPLLSGFPILPVVDFLASFPENGTNGFGVKTGARALVGGGTDDERAPLRNCGAHRAALHRLRLRRTRGRPAAPRRR